MKKVMRKVKKRWIVAGVAIVVSSLGGQVVSANDSTTSINEDTNVLAIEEDEVAPSVAEAEVGYSQATSTTSVTPSQPEFVTAYGTHTFTSTSEVKNAPTKASETVDVYQKGQSANYDRLVTNDNQQWISYVSYSNVRRYVSVGQVDKPTTKNPTVAQIQSATKPQDIASKAVANAQATSTQTSVAKPQPATKEVVEAVKPSVPSRGSYTFKTISAVKNEPRVASQSVAFYNKGEKVNYDRIVTADNHHWLSYTSRSGVRRFIAIEKATRVKQVSATPSQSTPATSVKPQTTATSKVAPKVQQTVAKPAETKSAPKPQTTASKSVAVKPQPATKEVVEAVKPSVPSRGSYTFKTISAVKNEPRVASQSVAFYNRGEKVNYDSIVTGDNHHWLSYTSRSGVRRYVAIEKATRVKQVPATPSQTTPATSVKPQASATSKAAPKVQQTVAKAVETKSAPKPQTTASKSAAVKPQPATKEVIEAVKPSISSRGSYTFKVKSDVKSKASVSSQTVATYHPGQRVNYDSIVTAENQHWLSYISKTGVRRYIAFEKATRVKQVPATPSQTTSATSVKPQTTTTSKVAPKQQQPVSKAAAVGKSASQGNYNVINKVVYLDSGHGGSDPGATYYGVREKDVNLNMQNLVKQKLEKQGYKVIVTSSGDTDTSLIDRSKKANASNADIFVSIHYNASSNANVSGIETYYYQEYKEYPAEINKAYHTNTQRLSLSNALATAIQNNVIASSGGVNRGVKRNTFSVLRETTAPSVLLELGYLSNRSENAKIKTGAYQEKLADGIVKGINAYYATKKKI